VLFASLSFGSLLRAHAFSASPYLRNDLISVGLNAYQEAGSTPFALSFASARQMVETVVAGSRFTYDARFLWGRISPVVRIEYRHRFAGRLAQSLSYADQPVAVYGLSRSGENLSGLSVAAGAELAVGGLVIGLEYSASGNRVDDLGGSALQGSVRLGF